MISTVSINVVHTYVYEIRSIMCIHLFYIFRMWSSVLLLLLLTCMCEEVDGALPLDGMYLDISIIILLAKRIMTYML